MWLAALLLLVTLPLLAVIARPPATATISLLQSADLPVAGGRQPTLADFWDGRATFLLTTPATGLPMGESETIRIENGHLWSYVHASDRSAGVIDRCGDPVEFPGCTVIYYSTDGGDRFTHEQPPVCQFECSSCPCWSPSDHIDQQQYPKTAWHNGLLYLVYEYRGTANLRISADGHAWSPPRPVGETGLWHFTDKPCPVYEQIGSHPFTPHAHDCLSGGPPGIFIEDDIIHIFVAMGQNPAHMGCWKGHLDQDPTTFTRCENNPLFGGAPTYGPHELRGKAANPWWDFRTISSAEILPVGEGLQRRYYMLYEGIRGPGPGDPGDTQFGLGLARSLTHRLDGPWETFPANPILVDLPANIGIGHADLIVLNGTTTLYTSLDGVSRSRLDLHWRSTENVAPPRTLLQFPEQAIAGGDHPTLIDFWEGRARFALETGNTGLPMGESETIILQNGEWWSYVHASDRSAGVIDRCGDPVEFPGCTVIYRSRDGGRTFAPDAQPVCQFECTSCPCTSLGDHIDQQQYPDLAFNPQGGLTLVYEYRGGTQMRTSPDGLTWSPPEMVAGTGHWRTSLRPCPGPEGIGQHPFVPYDYECLAGAPPGVHILGDTTYVLVGLGQNPGHMGCFKAPVGAPARDFRPCQNNPLFSGATEYGPLELRGAEARPWWDFRTISSADLITLQTPDGPRHYLVYEGLRGPGPGDPGDTQFGLGLARSLTDQIDGPWETFPGNPILANPPANIGIGHADLIVHNGRTWLYTSLDGITRSRLVLIDN
jgi:hypothetical protein